MKIWSQSPTLRTAFEKQIEEKVTANRAATRETLGEGILGQFGAFLWEMKRFSNQVKGNFGENMVSLMLQRLPDSYVLFNNALVPTNKSGRLTEIDHLIIGEIGVFVVELKTWKGSFSADRDKWKRREGNNWVAIDQSPSSQSVYHQRMFERWIRSVVPDLPENFITAPVVFPVAQWVGADRCSVPVLQGVQGLLDLVRESPERLTSQQVTEIATAVANYMIPEPAIAPPQPPTPKPIKKSSRPKVSNASKADTIPERASVAQIATAAVTEWLQNLPQTLSIQNVENEPDYQAIDVDFLLTTTKGEFKLKIKGDRYYKSGYFFFETHRDRDRNTPGCFLSTQADWFCYYFVPTGVLYLLPMPATRDWFLTQSDRFREKSIAIPSNSGDRYTTVGRLVPIEVVCQEVSDVKKHQLQ